MKVLILGSGVIGVTSAYYLQRLGHEVVVLDRLAAPAQATSFANAGQVSWGYASPWAAPGIPFKALRWLFDPHAPLVLRFRADPAMWRWLLAMVRECTAERYAINKARMLRVARYSQRCLEAMREETGIRYDDGQHGTLQVFRTAEMMDKAGADIEVLRRFGIPYSVLTREECLAVEPGLRWAADKIAGGLHLPGDETGDCHMFTTRLAELLQQRGVVFRTGVEVTRLVGAGDRIAGVVVDGRLETADTYLVAAGVWSTELVAPLGIRLPVHPVKGYSATLTIDDPEAAPRSTIMDEAHKVALTRLGNRIRAAGTAELAGFDTTIRPERREMIRHVVEDLFPRASRGAEISYWTGLRPMTPDGTPIIGATPYRNLFLNTGHGTLGWTMACGSGSVVADLISGVEPPIEADDLSVARYTRSRWSGPAARPAVPSPAGGGNGLVGLSG
jgi:D-amino-acid dehydrogenase